MKRQKNRCIKCYNYEVHFHEERLRNPLPKTKGDEFIWICSSCDISFVKEEWMRKILDRVCQMPFRQFFVQTKQSLFYENWIFPTNIWLGITLETNRDEGYEKISRAPPPSKRVENAGRTKIDIVTIEPIMDFDFEIFLGIIQKINPERVYIGYDTKKTHLNEPSLDKTMEFIMELETFTRVKPKLLRERWNGT